jgi:hypothetical protein
MVTSPYVAGPFVSVPPWPTLIAGPPGHVAGSGLVSPHAVATLAMIGGVTGMAGPHECVPPLARTFAQVEARSRSTEGAARIEAGALSARVAVMLPFAPTAPDSTTRPRALIPWSAKSTKSCGAGTCASAVLATIVVSRTGNAQRCASLVMSVPLADDARTETAPVPLHGG